MKTFLLAAACLLLGVSRAHADLTIVSKIEGGGEAIESVARYKDGKTRVDVPAQPSLITNAKTGETISLLPAQKRYLKVPAEVVKATADDLKKNQADTGKDKPVVVATGKKETISGFLAEEYTLTGAGSKSTLWQTKAVPNYEQIMRELGAAMKDSPLAALSQNFGLDLSALPGLTVRATFNLHGQTMTNTIVSISAEPIPDATFEIPAGYEAIVAPELTPRAALPATPRATP